MQTSIYTHQKPFVYLWRDRVLNKYYLGYHSGSNPNYICSSKPMMEQYNQRPHDFKRRILKVGPREEMTKLENRLVKSRRHQFGKRYYNLAYMSEKQFPIIRWTDEMRKKCGHRKGKTLSEEHCRKIGLAHKGKVRPNSGMKRPEVAEKVFAQTRGRKHTLEALKKMSIAHKGRPSPMKGKTLSEEHKRKMSITRKKWWVAKSYKTLSA